MGNTNTKIEDPSTNESAPSTTTTATTTLPPTTRSRKDRPKDTLSDSDFSFSSEEETETSTTTSSDRRKTSSSTQLDSDTEDNEAHHNDEYNLNELQEVELDALSASDPEYLVVGPKDKLSLKELEAAIGSETFRELETQLKCKLRALLPATIKDTCNDLAHRVTQAQLRHEDSKDRKMLAEMNLLGTGHSQTPHQQCTAHFSNWAGNVESCPQKEFWPKNLKQLQEAVLEAAANGKRIRAAGHKHSWSSIFPNNGDYIVYVRNIKQISGKNTGPEEDWYLQVQTGANTGEVLEFLKKYGMCLPANVILDKVQYGGIVCTGCHGTGLDVDTLSDIVLEMRIVDYKGRLRTFSLKEHGPRVMRAVGINMGLFGLIYDMKLKTQKTFNVHVHNMKPKLEDIFRNNAAKLKEIVKSHYAVECFSIPYVWDNMWIKTFQKTTEPVNVPPSKVCILGMENWLQLFFGSTVMKVLPYFAAITPLFLKAGFETLPENDYVQLLPDAIHYQKHLDDFVVGDMEFCFNIVNDDFSIIEKAWFTVIDAVKRHEDRGEYPLNVAMEMRFVRSSNAYISPAVNNTLSCYMEILSGINTPGFQEFEHEIAAEWMKMGARPHWAKYHQGIPGIVPYIKKIYGDDLKKFMIIRKELDVDPHGMFFNDFLKEVFE